METPAAHGARGPDIERRKISHAVVHRNEDTPQCAHDYDKQHGAFTPEPQDRERHPANAGERLQAKSKDADGVIEKSRAGRHQSDRQSDETADGITDEESPHRN